MTDKPLSAQTLVAQALGWRELPAHALVPPVHFSTTFERAEDGSYPLGYSYARDQNPTYDQVESLLARLEGGLKAKLFSSGMAACTAILEAVGPCPHLVFPESMYYLLLAWARRLEAAGRARLTVVPNADYGALEAALGKHEDELVWVETPSNPLQHVTDLARVVELAHKSGALVAADNTLASPILCQPLGWGVDLVVHSATKLLNGHADVVAGAVVTREENALWRRIGEERRLRGAILGPMEAWLLLRGMRTLHLRVLTSSASALAIAEALAHHPEVQAVYHAGLADHPERKIMEQQMPLGGGCMVSFRVRGGRERAREVRARMRLFRDATSLGGVESLVEHRALMEGPESRVPDDLLRLSVGIEATDELVSDLLSALDPP